MRRYSSTTLGTTKSEESYSLCLLLSAARYDLLSFLRQTTAGESFFSMCIRSPSTYFLLVCYSCSIYLFFGTGECPALHSSAIRPMHVQSLAFVLGRGYPFSLTWYILANDLLRDISPTVAGTL